jgi:diacylglycerol kinase (ATP)
MSKRKGESPTKSRAPTAHPPRCVIINPKASAVKDIKGLRKQLSRLGRTRIYITKKTGDAEEFARAAARRGCEEIIAAGGDGTLNEVVNGVAAHMGSVRVGLIPLGTGNDFARSLDLSADVEENIDILLAGKTMAVDVVKVRGERNRHFVNVSTGGFSGEVSEKMTPEIKRTWGSLAYLRGAAAALSELHGYRTTVVIDDKERLSLDLYNAVVANGRFIAGGLPIAPDASVTDGLLDVVLIPKQSAGENALLVAEIILGKHLSSNRIVSRRAKKVTVKSRPGMWFNVDGELVGNEPATFSVIPQALKFLVKKK